MMKEGIRIIKRCGGWKVVIQRISQLLHQSPWTRKTTEMRPRGKNIDRFSGKELSCLPWNQFTY